MKISKGVALYGALPPHVISEFKTRYTITNPKWAENKQMGYYNRDTPRYLRFYDIQPRFVSLPLGDADYIESVLTKYRVTFIKHDTRQSHPVDLKFRGQLKPYQQTAVEALLNHNYGTLEAPTGSGKTVIGLWMIAHRCQKTLVLVHTKELLYQWIERAEEFLGPDNYGIIGDGKYIIGEKVTFALVQSVYKRTLELMGLFGYVLVDECHRAPSRIFSEAIMSFTSLYKLGLTATPFRRDGLNKLIWWFVGPIRHKIDKKMLVRQGDILQPTFIMRPTGWDTIRDPVSEYSTMLSDLTQSVERNQVIVSDVGRAITDPGFVGLVLSDRKMHCYTLCDMLDGLGHQPLCLTGDVTKKEERKAIVECMSETGRLLVATGQLIGEGFDCKNLNTLFIASPIRFSGRVLQYIGRIMRPAPGKDRPVVYDYVDWDIKQLAKSANHRINVYGKENVIVE